MHPIARPKPPLLVYVEANILVFWILRSIHDPSGRHHHSRCRQEANRLIQLCGRHTGQVNHITIVTSQWALTEVHSTMYSEALWAEQHRLGNLPRDARNYFPPDQLCLVQATQLLNSKIQDLASIVHLRIDQPSAAVWRIAHQIGEECGIHAPDCLHLATALDTGCEMFVTQDIKFLNKIHYFQAGAISNIAQQIYRGTAFAFEACPLTGSRDLHRRNVPIARTYLTQQGY